MQEQNKRYILGSCFYAFFVNGVTCLILGSLLPYLTQTYGHSYQLGGLLLSVRSAGTLAAVFIAGALPAYLGRKRSVLLLCSAVALGFLGITLSDTPLLLLLSFLLTGIGCGSVSNFNNIIVTETSDGNPKALNILHSFFAVGAFLAPFLVLMFTQHNPEHWKLASLLVTFLACVMVALFGFMKMDRSSEKSAAAKQEKSFAFLKNAGFWISCAILFFYLCAETAIIGWLVTYFKDSGMMTDNYAQMLVSLLWLIILVGRLTCAYLSQIVSNQKILIGTAAGTLAFFILLLATRSLAVITFSIIGLGFCMSGIFPTTISNVSGVIKSAPMAMSTLLAIANSGSIIMPAVTGVVADCFSIYGGMAVISVAVVLNLVFAVINALYKPQKQPDCSAKN